MRQESCALPGVRPDRKPSPRHGGRRTVNATTPSARRATARWPIMAEARVVSRGDGDMDASDADGTGMTAEEKRRDQLTAAPGAVESDADPRIEVTRRDGVTRIDIREDADVRPGDPTKEPRE